MSVLFRSLFFYALAFFVAVRSDLLVPQYVDVLEENGPVLDEEKPEVQIGQDYGKSNVVDPMPQRMDPGFRAVKASVSKQDLP